MKKLFLLSLLFVAVISSCKKDRVCRCTVVSTGLINATFNDDTTFTNVSKKDAEAKCSGLNSFVEEPITNTSVETTCELN